VESASTANETSSRSDYDEETESIWVSTIALVWHGYGGNIYYLTGKSKEKIVEDHILIVYYPRNNGVILVCDVWNNATFY
jgi:hypothetical protein